MSNALAIVDSRQEHGNQSITLTVDAASLSRALQLAQLIAKAKSTLPLLKSVKLTAMREGLGVQATDSETHSMTTVYAVVNGIVENVSVCVPPDALRKALLKSGDATLTFDGENLMIGAYRIRTESADKFPTAELPLAAVVTNLFPDDLRRVAFAMSKDITRYNLCTCLLESVNGKQRLVATDGHRLALVDTERHYVGPKLMVPRNIVDIILKLKPSGAMVGVNKEKVVFSLLGYGSLVINHNDSEFPDYPVVIPRNQAGHVIVNRVAWLRALSDLLPVVKGARFVLVKHQLVGNDRLTLSAETEAQSANCSIEIETGQNTNALAEGWGMNLVYVKDILSSLTSEKVRVGFNDPQSQFTIGGDNEHDAVAIHVVMPARV